MDLPTDGAGRQARGAALGATSGFAALAAVFAAVIALYFDSARDLYVTWADSPTYNHCLLVLPVTVWFLWRLRGELSKAPLRPWLPALALVGMASLVWLAGALTDIKSLRDLALVLFVPATLAALLGRRFAGVALFPLVFTLFAWPFGEIFVPTMMGWTADFTVAALRATGVPVFREGNNFVIPSGTWSVVEECSGIRYLMASLSAGAFYAYMNFRSYRRRALFIALSLIVPVAANWLRAYFTVLLGHLSDNTIAVGFDHLVYGWVFFGIVMFGLFLIGARMIDEPPQPRAAAPGATLTFSRAVLPAAVAVTVIAAIGPGWHAWAGSRAVSPISAGAESLRLPEALGDWHRERPDPLVQGPVLPTGLVAVSGRYGRAGQRAGMHVAAGWGDDPRNTVFSYNTTGRLGGNRRWNVVEERVVSVPGTDGVSVLERVLTDGGRKLMLWQWYRVGTVDTASLLRAKVAVAASRLAGREAPGVAIVLYAEFGDEPATARATLAEFRGAMSPVLESWIER